MINSRATLVALTLGAVLFACGGAGSTDGGTGGGMQATGGGGSTGTGGGSTATGGGSGTGGGSTSTGGGSGTGGGTDFCDCTGNTTCAFLTVTRSADTSTLPWSLWPNEADGKGTVIAAVGTPGGSATQYQRKTVADADFTAASARYELNMGCFQPGTYQVSAFLDDNTNAMATAISSSDYRDACTSPRTAMITVANMPINHAVVFAQSCD